MIHAKVNLSIISDDSGEGWLPAVHLRSTANKLSIKEATRRSPGNRRLLKSSSVQSHGSPYSPTHRSAMRSANSAEEYDCLTLSSQLGFLQNGAQSDPGCYDPVITLVTTGRAPSPAQIEEVLIASKPVL